MSLQEREPTRDELLAMAYVDGELSDEARRDFEARLPDEPFLNREVSELKKLATLARRVAPPEPMDHEWKRLEGELLYGGGSRLGLFLIAIGVLGGSAFLFLELFRSSLGTGPKVLVGILLSGVCLLFLTTLRGRLKTLPYDPYTEVKR